MTPNSAMTLKRLSANLPTAIFFTSTHIRSPDIPEPHTKHSHSTLCQQFSATNYHRSSQLDLPDQTWFHDLSSNRNTDYNTATT